MKHKLRRSLLGRHAHRGVDPNHLSVEKCVFDDVSRERRKLAGVAHALGELLRTSCTCFMLTLCVENIVCTCFMSISLCAVALGMILVIGVVKLPGAMVQMRRDAASMDVDAGNGRQVPA